MQACPDDEFLFELASGALDPDGLARADRHLDQCEGCRSLIAELALASGGDGALPRGAQIGRYIIIDVIGRGAMGTVYAAFDPELDRRVALKLLRHASTNQDDDLLLDEAKSMAKLTHPNVVRVYDAGRASDTVYLAMELVDGVSLTTWLRDEKRSWRDIRDVFVEAASGLAAAHQAGIVHRDIKPDNIMVTTGGKALVTDFGVAAASAPIAALDPGESISLTQTTVFAGTPAYMSPEQLAGKSATASTDQFSLCVSLFEALAGSRPFEGSDVAELRAAMASSPSASGLSAPRWLTLAIERGLAPRSADRFASVDELRDALLTDKRRAPRRRVALIGLLLSATAGATLLLGSQSSEPLLEVCAGSERLAAVVWGSERSSRLRTHLGDTARADLTIRAFGDWSQSWIDNHRTVCRATAVDKTQSSRLLDARMNCLDRRLRDADALIAGLESGAPDLAADATHELADPAACSSMSEASLADPPTATQAAKLVAHDQRLAQARALRALGQYKAAAVEARRATKLAEEIGYAPAVAESELLDAQSSASADDFDNARRAAKRALRIALSTRADALLANVLIALTAIEGESGNLELADEHAAMADAVLERIERPARLEADLSIATALVLLAKGDAKRARLALEKGAASVSPRERSRLLTLLAELAKRNGDLDLAEKTHQAALELNRSNLGEAHPAIATNLHNIAGVLRVRGELERAEELYRQALALKRKAYGNDHSEVAITRNSLALIFIERGELDAAKLELLAARDIFESSGHPQLAVVLENLKLASSRRQQPADKKPADKKPADKKPADKQPSGYIESTPWQKGRH